MAELKASRVFAVVPLLAFLGICIVFQQNGKEGAWHERCVGLWKAQQWPEITALAENLSSLGKPDTEAFFFATMASLQQTDSEQTRVLAHQVLQQRFLNLQFEIQIAKGFHPQGLAELIRLRRSSLVLSLLILISILSLFALKWKTAGGWLIVMSALGCIILLV